MDPVIPAGYGCPCHGGQYDPEGNRTAGPPTRALDRYDFAIDQRAPHPPEPVLRLARRRHRAHGPDLPYKEAGPGEHIDGPEQILYPIQPPHN